MRFYLNFYFSSTASVILYGCNIIGIIQGNYLFNNSYNGDYSLKCNGIEDHNNDLITNIDSDIRYLWDKIEKGVAKAKGSILSERYMKTSMEYKTMAFILAGLGATTLSGNLRRTRLCSVSPTCRPDEPKRDIAFTIGTPLYGFSFSIGRFLKLKPLNLDCGINSLNQVLNKYGHLKSLNGLEHALNNIDRYGIHPLLQIQADQLPDVISHQLDLFNFRLKVALSCLFEDGDKEANRLARRINSLISTLKERLTLLTNNLNHKISTFQTPTFYQQSMCT